MPSFPKLKLFLYLLPFIVISSSAQDITDSVSSWKSKVASATSDSVKLVYCLKVVDAYMDSQPEVAINYWIDVNSSMSSILFSINESFESKSIRKMFNSYNQLMDSILKAKIVASKEGESKKHLAFYYWLLANDAAYRGLNQTCTDYGLKADKIFNEINYPEGPVLFIMTQLYIYNTQGQSEKGLELLHKISPDNLRLYPEGYGWIKNYLLMVHYIHLQNTDSALYYATKGAESIRTVYHRAYLLGVTGLIYAQDKQYDKAIEILQQAKQMDLQIENLVEYYRCQHWLGEIYVEKGDYKSAIEPLTDVIKNTNLKFETGAYIGALTALAKVYSEMGDYKKAYQYLKLGAESNDTINGIKTRETITEMQTKYDSENKDNEIAKQKLQLSRQLLINYGAGAFGLLLVLFLILVYRNYRQKKKANVELQAAKERAEQSEKFKQQFLANMSHEIRTPMNAVMGMTNLLIDKNPRNDQVNYLDGIKKSSGTLLHIINDILDVSKIEAGKIELEQIDFSIYEVVDQVKRTLQNKANECGIQLITNIDSNIPEVVIGDPIRLNQVLINMAGNAIKFTEKGSVTIDVSRGEKGVRFAIIDTGVGIPKEKLQSVFESFSQVHVSDTRRFGGTGLGLTISKQLVELMGGNLYIESEVGTGSIFSFEINYQIGSAERMQHQRTSEQIDGSILNGLKILITDDNDYNRIVARDTLKAKASVEIIEAVNGEDALEKLNQYHFDVVLMDVQMPVMDGYEATNKIRNQFAVPKNEIPVIALTASVIRSDLEKCRQSGMTDYIPKPFKVSQLISTIAKATGREIKYIKHEQDEIVVKTVHKNGAFDLSYLEEFCEGDHERIKKYINIFLESSPLLTEKLESALNENNFEEIANQVHGFKTKWIMMGMDEAKDLAMNIEFQCRKETPDHASIKASTLRLISLVETTVIELQQTNSKD